MPNSERFGQIAAATWVWTYSTFTKSKTAKRRSLEALEMPELPKENFRAEIICLIFYYSNFEISLPKPDQKIWIPFFGNPNNFAYKNFAYKNPKIKISA